MNLVYGLVVDHELRRSPKNDRYFWQVNLKTRQYGVIKAFIWGASAAAESDPIYPHKGEFVILTKYVDQLADKGSFVIEEWQKTIRENLPEEEQELCAVLSASPEDIGKAIHKITERELFSDEKIYAFLVKCLSAVGLENIKKAPAAANVHHNYIGGLAIHTAEVVKICQGIYEATKEYGFINSDVLYCAAVLHDMGKVATYSTDDLGIAQSNYDEKCVGHMYYSMHLVQKVYEENLGLISKEFLIEVLHCIAAHHGRIEWGSIKEEQSLEAGILSRADFISSRNGMMENTLKEMKKSNQKLPEQFKIYGDNHFATLGIKNYFS